MHDTETGIVHMSAAAFARRFAAPDPWWDLGSMAEHLEAHDGTRWAIDELAAQLVAERRFRVPLIVIGDALADGALRWCAHRRVGDALPVAVALDVWGSAVAHGACATATLAATVTRRAGGDPLEVVRTLATGHGWATMASGSADLGPGPSTVRVGYTFDGPPDAAALGALGDAVTARWARAAMSAAITSLTWDAAR